MTAIVTCGNLRQSLAAVRSLGRAKIPVVVSAGQRPSLAMWSRFATSTFIAKDPKKNAKSFIEQLSYELKGRYALCAFPSSDDAFWAMSRFRDYLPISARKILPPHYSVVRSLDHEALHIFADSLGIPCAPLVCVAGQSSLSNVLQQVESLRFPLLMRTIVPWLEREDGTRSFIDKVVIHSKSHLKETLQKNLHWLDSGILVSAYRSVQDLSFFGVCEKGKVLASGFQVRLNEQEPYNEVATLARTVAPVPLVKRYGRKLLEALQWQGPFKIEFICNEEGEYQLSSLVGRFWGSMQLAIKSGVNIPLICYRMSEGTLTKDLVHNAKPHHQLRWLMGDSVAKFWGIKNLILGMASPNKNSISFKKIFSGFSFRKSYGHFDVLDFEDPMPFLFEIQHKTWRKAFQEND